VALDKENQVQPELEILDETQLLNGTIIGVDLGGTRVRAVLSSGTGQILARAEMFTEADQGLEHVLSNIRLTIKAVMDLAEFSNLVGLAVGAPGPLNPYTGVVYSPPNLPGWSNVPLVDILEKATRLPVYLGNDANLAALGEYTFGAGKDYRYLVYITVSTGVGGGVIEDGRILMGAKGAAAELGHMSVEYDGPRCNCGNLGCLEALTAGPYLRKRAIELLESGQKSKLTDMAGGNLQNITPELISEAAYEGDETAKNLVLDTAFYLGVGVTNILHLFNPEIVVIGGGVSKIGPMLFDRMREVVTERAMPAFHQNVPIVQTSLGGDIGLYGTIALVLQNYEKAKERKQLLTELAAEEV
jgi:glucokinase